MKPPIRPIAPEVHHYLRHQGIEQVPLVSVCEPSGRLTYYGPDLKDGFHLPRDLKSRQRMWGERVAQAIEVGRGK